MLGVMRKSALIVLFSTVALGQMDMMESPENGGMSRMFKPPFPATTVEVTPKFKVVSERGPLSISTGISFPIELELDSDPEAIRELDEPLRDVGRMPGPGKMGFMMNANGFLKKAAYPKVTRLKSPKADRKSTADSYDTKNNKAKYVAVRGGRALTSSVHVPRAIQDRLHLFQSVSLSLSRLGVGGEQCLLRAICEAAKFPQANEEGLVGQIVTLLLTVPNNTLAEMKSYNEATERGKIAQNCSSYLDCPISVFNVVNL